jgi:hypothetical protein
MTSSARRTLTVAVGITLVAGAIRLADLSAPGILVEREYRSAIIARSILFEIDPPKQAWRAEVAVTSWRREGRLEPPLTEALVALVYRVIGDEDLRVGRVLCVAFWLFGAPFVYWMARRVASRGGAIVALGFYLLTPLGVNASRSFQPEALMTLGLILGLHASLRDAEAPSWRRFAWALASAAGAIFVKPFVLFPLLFSHLKLSLDRAGLRGCLSRRTLAYVLLAPAPAIAWYAFGALWPGDWDVGVRWTSEEDSPSSAVLRQIWMSLAPEQLFEPRFWYAWGRLALTMVGIIALPAGIFGALASRSSPLRSILIGAWLSYPLLGLATSGLIADHGYYQIQLLPLVALGLASLTDPLRERFGGHFGQAAPAILIVLALAWSVHAVVQAWRIRQPVRFESSEICQAIGSATNHSTRTVYVARNYGRPLEYHGELSGVPWPNAWLDGRRVGDAPLSVESRIALLTFEPEYFIISDLRRFERYHEDLARWLPQHCRPIEESKEYTVWSRCSWPQANR